MVCWELLTLPLLASESPQSAGSVRLLDFFSSWSPASSMMGSSLVCAEKMWRFVVKRKIETSCWNGAQLLYSFSAVYVFTNKLVKDFLKSNSEENLSKCSAKRSLNHLKSRSEEQTAAKPLLTACVSVAKMQFKKLYFWGGGWSQKYSRKKR